MDAQTRVLVLGSLPGEASLKAGRYYAHPQNAFWRLMGRVLDDPDFADLPYEDRLARLLARGVGLWDVVAKAEREGSLDSNIKAVEHSDLQGLVEGLPRLQAVAFNGGTANRIGLRQLGALANRMATIRLPSSSPAHAGKLFEAKAAEWLALRPFLTSP